MSRCLQDSTELAHSLPQQTQLLPPSEKCLNAEKGQTCTDHGKVPALESISSSWASLRGQVGCIPAGKCYTANIPIQLSREATDKDVGTSKMLMN